MTYTIFRKLETGELLRVATRDDLREAEQLAQSLHEYWPAEYSVLDRQSAAEVEKNRALTIGRSAEYPTGKRSPFASR